MLLSPDLYEEIRLCRAACGEAHMKTILATGELGSLANVYKASMIAMMAGKSPFKLRMFLLYYLWGLKNSGPGSLVLSMIEKTCVAITEAAGGVIKSLVLCNLQKTAWNVK